MSRLAKKGIKLPSGTTLTVADNTLSVKGPKGELSRPLNPLIEIILEGDSVSFKPKVMNLETKSLVGTVASHTRNMVNGVNDKFKKVLILEGIGYKMEVKDDTLHLALGFSHPVLVPIPKGIEVAIEKGTMTITGSDKETVGEFAARVRDLKKPEPYKGKGFRYSDEVIKRKQGKKSV